MIFTCVNYLITHSIIKLCKYKQISFCFVVCFVYMYFDQRDNISVCICNKTMPCANKLTHASNSTSCSSNDRAQVGLDLNVYYPPRSMALVILNYMGWSTLLKQKQM